MDKIERTNFNHNDVILDGTKYLIANGYYGYRGTLSEFTKAEMVAFNLNGVYDQQGDLWRESVNAFNPLYTVVYIKGSEMNPMRVKPLKHKQGIDIEKGLFYRNTVFPFKQGTIAIKSVRFADQTNKELIYERYTIEASTAVGIDLYTGIDLDVYNLSGNHLKIEKIVDEIGFFFVKSKTQEQNLPLVVGETTTRSFPEEGKTVFQNNKVLRHYRIVLEENKPIQIDKFGGVCHSRKNAYQYLDMLVTKAQKFGYDRRLRENEAFWRKKWEIAKIEIVGDKLAELGLNYSIYQLISARPYSDEVSIPAKGLSGQAYKGAVYWDAEVFMLPFFLNTDQESARHIIMYRILGLKGAMAKAKQYGYAGAFYPWESQERGYEACSDYNITNAITGEPIRTHFREKQIHVNGAVVYALKQYLERTEDYSVLFSGGLEMVMECAKFYASYLTYNRETKRYEALKIDGPDEYHELVDNSTYTMYMIDFVFEQADNLAALTRKIDYQWTVDLMKEHDYNEEIKRLRLIREKLYLPEPQQMVYPQFDGYFELEDIKIKDLKKRMSHPDEYLGGEKGLATTTQIVKQPEIVILQALFPEKFTRIVKKMNFRYYEDKTEHIPSLSSSMYALLASDIDKANSAYPYFMNSATVNLKGETKQFNGGVFIGGMNLASCGGAYYALVYGFSGLKHRRFLLMADTRLASKIKEVKFNVIVGGRIASVKVTSTVAAVTWEKGYLKKEEKA
ncbi:MAG: glycoside hydrolase family 65 protein [Candidatus Izemoplasmatales bacterium]|jgi:nigerose phosphorylase